MLQDFLKKIDLLIPIKFIQKMLFHDWLHFKTIRPMNAKELASPENEICTSVYQLCRCLALISNV